MVSFDTFLQQENEYLQILVSKITDTKPDVVFVEKNVSMRAQEILYEKGVTLLVNVKKAHMRTISRISQTQILVGAEHAMSTKQGKCGRFQVKHYTGPWGQKSLTFLEGCNKKESFGTIVLRGAPSNILSNVKKATMVRSHSLFTILMLSFCASWPIT